MANDLRWHIFQSMDGKPTEELLEIWQANDCSVWSDLAFEVVAEILQQRLGELPVQNEPITVSPEPSQPAEDFEPVGDEPEFYRPKEILWLQKQLKWVSVVFAAGILLVNIISIPSLLGTFSDQIPSSSLDSARDAWITILFIIFTLFCAVIGYLALRWLASILGILMEMEYNSRSKRELPRG